MVSEKVVKLRMSLKRTVSVRFSGAEVGLPAQLDELGHEVGGHVALEGAQALLHVVEGGLHLHHLADAGAQPNVAVEVEVLDAAHVERQVREGLGDAARQRQADGRHQGGDPEEDQQREEEELALEVGHRLGRDVDAQQPDERAIPAEEGA